MWQFVEGTRTGAAGPPGFPTLRTLSTTGELRKAAVNVFGMASRKESLILRLKVLPTCLKGVLQGEIFH
jgi:hypothetical protein